MRSFIKSLNIQALRNRKAESTRVFKGSYAKKANKRPRSVTIVSYNIQYGLNVSSAISSFKSIRSLGNADFVLLQEMDEAGVKRFAKELKYNYVYYAAGTSVYTKNFGNAVLTKFPIQSHRKVKLPNQHPLTREKRIATKAVIVLHKVAVSLYSIHTEVYSTLPSYRKAQVDAIIKDIRKSDNKIIIGGDFNTFSRRGIKRLDKQFHSVELVRVTDDSLATIKMPLINPVLDHIYARGFSLKSSGSEINVEASDHIPVWAKISLVD